MKTKKKKSIFDILKGEGKALKVAGVDSGIIKRLKETGCGDDPQVIVDAIYALKAGDMLVVWNGKRSRVLGGTSHCTAVWNWLLQSWQWEKWS